MAEIIQPLIPNNNSSASRLRSQSFHSPTYNSSSERWSSSDAQSFILQLWGENAPDPKSQMDSFRLVVLCALIASLTSLLLGYDVGIFSSAILYIKEEMNLTLFQSEAVVAALNLVAALGSLVAGSMADLLGRKAAIGCACIIFILGATLMTFSTTFVVIMCGRVLTGLGVGCGFVISPVYVTEIAPVSIRGRLVSFCDIAINLGIVIGYATGYACEVLISNESLKWRVMLGIGIIPPALIITGLFMLPESPRWLLAQGRDKEGYEVLRRITKDEGEAILMLKAIHNAVIQQNMHGGGAEVSWIEALLPSDPVYTSALLIALGLGFWQQATGSEAAVYYSPSILREAGYVKRREMLGGTMVIGMFKLGGEIIAAMLLDLEGVGRRPLFLVSSILSTLALLGLSISLYFSSLIVSSMPLICLCLFMGAFSVGMGPLTFVVASEVCNQKRRGKVVSAAVFVNRAMSGVISLSYLSLAVALTPSGAFLLFTGISAVSVLFYGLFVPETYGRTLEEIESEIYRNVHAGHPQAVNVNSIEHHKNVHTLPYSSRLASSASSGHIYTLVTENDNDEASYIYAEGARDRQRGSTPQT